MITEDVTEPDRSVPRGCRIGSKVSNDGVMLQFAEVPPRRNDKWAGAALSDHRSGVCKHGGIHYCVGHLKAVQLHLLAPTTHTPLSLRDFLNA